MVTEYVKSMSPWGSRPTPQGWRPVLSRLDTEQLARLLGTATAVSDASDRLRILAELAPHLPENLLPQAVTAATAVPFRQEKPMPAMWGDPLSRGLEWYLRAGSREGLYKTGGGPGEGSDDDLATEMPKLIGLYARLELPFPAAARRDSVGDELTFVWSALAHARSAAWPDDHVTRLLSSARGLSAHALGQVWAAAAAVSQPAARARALTGLLPLLPTPLDRGAVGEALSAALAISQPDGRAAALTKLVPHVPAGERDGVTAQALAAAELITWPDDRAAALSSLVAVLPVHLVGPAMIAASSIALPRARARALTSLLSVVPAADREHVVDTVLESCWNIDSPT
nr:hypothetical protein [Micromonospora sp. DSM 115978]